MKNLLLSAIVIGACVTANGGTYLKENPIMHRWDIIKNNRFSGYIERNQLLKGRVDVFDRTGKHEGHWKRNDLLDRWEFRKGR